MQIDIRDNSKEIDSIVFGSEIDVYDAYILTLGGDLTKIESQHSHVCLGNREDAKNLIKALQKAIELGNWS